MKQLKDIIFKTEPVEYSNYKVVLSGKFAECYKFRKAVVLNQRPKRIKKESEYKKSDPLGYEILRLGRHEEYVLRKKNRAYKAITRLIESNFNSSSVFLTLTFADNIKDIRYALKKFHIFCVQIRKIIPDFKYIAVPEFQDGKRRNDKQGRGAIHFHMILGAYLDVNLVLKYWPHGLNKIIKIYSTRGIGVYFAKYLSKNAKDNKFFGLKSYYHSKNLKKPKVFYCLEAEKLRNLIYKNCLPIFSKVYNAPDFSKQNIRDQTDLNYIIYEKFDISKLLPIYKHDLMS